MDYSNNTWKVIDNYFKSNKNYLTKHHLDSYNDFVLNKIPQTLKQYNPQIHYKEYNKENDFYKYETQVFFGGEDSSKVYVGKPIIYSENGEEVVKRQMYPNEARLKGLTYGVHIFCDILVKFIIRNDNGEIVDESEKTFDNVTIGRMPVMLQSKLCVLNGKSQTMLREMGECVHDQGGYFIVSGAEKVIVSHERKAENKLYIVQSNDGVNRLSAQIKSVPEDSFKFARTTVVNFRESGEFMVRLPMMGYQIPLFIVFRLLGIESDKDILKMILYNLDTEKSRMFLEDLESSVVDAGPIFNQMDAVRYVANLTKGNSISNILDILKTDLFPHVGTDYHDKAYYLGYCVNKILCVHHGLDKPTDRDSFMYKRVDLSGFLLANLFREAYKQFQRDSKIALDTEYRFNSGQYQDSKYVDIISENTLKKMFDGKVIEKMMMKSFKIGTVRILNYNTSVENWKKFKNWINESTNKFNRVIIVGSGGNASKILKIAEKNTFEVITIRELEEINKLVNSMSFHERVEKLQLNVDRADVIVPAMNIYLKAMEYSNSEAFLVPRIGLVDGLIRQIYLNEKQGQKLN